MQYIFGMIMS